MIQPFLQFILLAQETQKNKGLKIPLEALWIVGILVAAFFLLRITRARIARNQAKYNTPFKERLAEKQKSSATVNQMSELMASLADLSRQINGQIDTRLTKLEVLLHQADQTIEKLSQLSDGETPSSPNLNHRPLDASGDVVKEISQKFKSPPADISPDADSPALSPETRQIMDLTKKGHTPIEIAQQLSRPVGEIELIISLARKNNS